MPRYRPRAVLLLFGVLYLTACQTWNSVSLDAISPAQLAQLIEEDQPDRVRVLLRGGNELELERPAVDVMNSWLRVISQCPWQMFSC